MDKVRFVGTSRRFPSVACRAGDARNVGDRSHQRYLQDTESVESAAQNWTRAYVCSSSVRALEALVAVLFRSFGQARASNISIVCNIAKR
jgi:hypothetical protein